MDDERNNGGSAPENDYESQLAELIKQSGGTVPPKKKPEPAPAPQKEQVAPSEKTAEEIDAEIEAMINSMSDSDSSARTDVPPFVMPDSDFAAPKNEAPIFDVPTEESPAFETEGDASAFVMPESESAQSETIFAMPEENVGFVMPEDDKVSDSEQSIEDIIAEIERLEKETASAEREKEEAERARLEEEEAMRREAERAERVGAKLDDELEAMLESLAADEPASAEPVQPTEPEQPVEPNAPAKDEELINNEKPSENSEPTSTPPIETKEKESESAELFGEPVEIVGKQENHDNSVPIDVSRFDKVEPPKEDAKSLDVAKMEAMLQELLGDDRAKKEEKEQAVVSEMEQMRAKIASLEYMLANVDRKKADEAKVEETKTPPPQNDARKIIEQASNATKSDDINSMFKQWFDLEMAAKMKNIITEDEKKQAGEKEKQPSYDKAPAVYNEPEQGSDFIKLSDNVYYNVREKKTYVMRELKPTVAAPKKKIVKKKIVRKAAPRPRRALHARPGMRPRRPRRPLGSPRRRRP